MEKDDLLILDLGCGKKKTPNSIGVDISEKYDADVVHDLNRYPYPFEDESARHVILDNVLEHLNEPLKALEEIHRVLHQGGTVKVVVPYFRSAWAAMDPTHKTFFSVQTFHYFDRRHEYCQRYEYVDYRFDVESVVFNETLTNGFMRSLVVKLANRWPTKYEIYLSHLFPLDDLTFLLRKV